MCYILKYLLSTHALFYLRYLKHYISAPNENPSGSSLGRGMFSLFFVLVLERNYEKVFSWYYLCSGLIFITYSFLLGFSLRVHHLPSMVLIYRTFLEGTLKKLNFLKHFLQYKNPSVITTEGYAFLLQFSLFLKIHHEYEAHGDLYHRGAGCRQPYLKE